MHSEFHFIHDGRTYRCWAESGNVSAAPPPAIPSNAHWFAEVDGRQYRLFAATDDDVATPAKRKALERSIVAAVTQQNSMR